MYGEGRTDGAHVAHLGALVTAVGWVRAEAAAASCFETSGTRDGNTDPPNGPNHDPRVYFSPCSGHLHMPNIATASTHRAGSARPAGHAWPECCCCEIAMLGNVFSYVSAYKSTEKKCYEKNRKASEKPR